MSLVLGSIRRARRFVCAPGALALALLTSRAVHADPLPVELAWDAPAECPSQSEVMSELSRITRVKPGRVVTAIRAQAQIARTSDGHYKLSLRTEREDQTGDTELEATSCSVLKRGVTLVLALALGDGIDLVDDGSNEHVIEPKPSASAPNEATAPPKRARKMQPHSARSSQLYLAPSLAALAAWGLIAKPSFGAELGLGVGSAHFYGLGELELWPSQIAVRVAGVSASLEALVGAVGGCARQPLGAWSLAGCARLELGAIHGDSSGAYRDGAATAPYYALGPVLVLSVPLFGAVHARLESSLDVALDPPRFALRSFGEIDAVSRFSPSVSLGLELEPARR